jgi:hypothetical protein
MAQFSLIPQTYGIAMAQCVYGGPRGVWLECTSPNCLASDKIRGRGAFDLTDAQAAKIFRKGGWTGDGPRMLKAKCPACSRKLFAEG